MGNYLKQGVLFRGKTWLGMPEGNLFLFIQSVLVQQVTLTGPVHQQKNLSQGLLHHNK